MANRVSQTYDDITRRTVPDLDSSTRPSKDQERQAFEGYRAMDEHETALHARVMDALRNSGVNWQGVTVEVERDRVSVRGNVDEDHDLRRIPEIIRGVDGVASVEDRLVVLPGGAAD
ncbi:MAG TPA: BON domain-containing protein [Kofleriaceae bacterium]|nr:BON domain-containing protein [Kofleriaceae bacterium]